MPARGRAAVREATIDLDAIADNVRHLRRLTGVDVIAVVKAEGYGHGAVDSATAALAGGANRLAVATVEEALALRRAGVNAAVLAWLHAPDRRFDDAAEAGIELGISSFEQLVAASEAASGGAPVAVHLKVDTGLSRNGIAAAEWPRVFAEAARMERIGRIRVVGLFSHLSNATRDDDMAQLASFENAAAMASGVGIEPEVQHLAATAAAIDHPETRLDAVRIGIGMYGLSPFADRSSADLGLRPAMTLRGQIAAVRRVPAGSGVSYDFTYRAEHETTLALVPLGYADGVPRQASGSGPVSIGGRRYRVAGRIAMDQFLVDVGDAEVAVGDEVVLFGDPTLGQPSATDWADAAGTINYEIVTRIGPRVLRRAVS
ncbi:alanine racemase [Microbacterium pseudoresistens]|uniref:Alanine racemase n=1 Tax=Microbacterium pseudoresistens TaxID=640634 RepID=A0A7Y9EV99_9MICO|nr:alanine racemase [Microbacterium pseudoresistens]NYD54617.1 alanine racemase [Microbacterium pseudoresistens]